MSYKRPVKKTISVATTADLNGSFGIILFAAFALILFVLSSLRPNLFMPARMAISDIAAPVLATAGRPFVAAGDMLAGAADMAALEAENMRLSQENERLREWHQAALMLNAENKSLKTLLNVPVAPGFDFVTARVLSDAGQAFVRTILIDAGSENGVYSEQAVVARQGVIGRTIEAGRNTARVLLLTDINSRLPIMVADTAHYGILAGKNGDELDIVHLPPDANISVGSTILTSGLGGIYPAGLPVGKVVETRNGVPVVRLFSDPAQSGHVKVIKKMIQPATTNGVLSGSPFNQP